MWQSLLGEAGWSLQETQEHMLLHGLCTSVPADLFWQITGRNEKGKEYKRGRTRRWDDSPQWLCAAPKSPSVRSWMERSSQISSLQLQHLLILRLPPRLYWCCHRNRLLTVNEAKPKALLQDENRVYCLKSQFVSTWETTWSKYVLLKSFNLRCCWDVLRNFRRRHIVIRSV